MTVRRHSGLDVVVDPVRAEASLWRRLRFEDDTACRSRLFDRYIVLAKTLAARHLRRGRRTGAERGDAEQYAYEGLLQALDRFDPLQGVPFGAYASRRIAGSISTGMSRMTDMDAQLGYQRRTRQERVRLLSRKDVAQDPLSALGDLAVGIAIGLMLEGTGMIEPLDGADLRPNAYEGLAWRQAQAALATEITLLPENEGIVVRQHYQVGMSFAQIAELLRLSRGRISQLHHAALDRLRRRLRNYRG